MASQTEQTSRLFSVAEYHEMGTAAILGSDERVELVRGVVVPMTPKSWAHTVATNQIAMVLREGLAGRAGVVTEGGLRLESLHSEPEPDVMVLSTPGLLNAPSEARLPLLVIEVAGSSIHYDLGEKSKLYALAGIRESWVLSLAVRELVVMREPRDGIYTSRTMHSEGSRVSVLSWRDVEVDVSALLPDPATEGG